MNEKINELYNKLDAQDEIIEQQVAIISEQKKMIGKAIEYIKEHIRVDDEYPDYMEMLIEERNELLAILGDKENEWRRKSRTRRTIWK